MSSVAALFGDKKKDAQIVGLFSETKTGPVERRVAPRTVLKVETKPKEGAEDAEDAEDAEEDDDDDDDEQEDKEEEKSKKRKRGEDEEEDDDLEAKYLEKLIEKNEDEDEDEDEEQDQDETAKSKKERKPKELKATTLDLREDEVEKAEKTIFIGNLSSTVITSKSDFKQLKKHFSQAGEIDSIRFRSISFDEALPRKVAFVKQKLHNSRDSVNAYLVFKTKEAVSKAIELFNGSVFLNLHLRVDSVSHPSKIDNKKTIFVGNLDFEEKDEELWTIFESCGEIESVRIVRDSKTNMGKGFAYVQFKDITSVSKALLLNETKLGSKKRKLRISRSKSIKKSQLLKQRNERTPVNPRERNLTPEQKTKLGRAKKILGKADRSRAGKVIIEGERAKEGTKAIGIKTKNRTKKPRITERSKNFKKARKD